MKTKEILKNLRKKNGYSAQQVAEGCGMSLGVYKKYESGERGVGTPALCKLADFHGVTTDYLLGRDTTQPVEDVSKMSDNELDKKLMQFFMDLPENSKQGIRNFVLSIAHGLNEESAASKQQEESQQQQQAPELPIVQSIPQSPPQPVESPPKQRHVERLGDIENELEQERQAKAKDVI